MSDIERLNVLSPRPRANNKTYWMSVGTAFRSKDNSGWDVLFDAFPLPDEKGQLKVMIRPFKERDEQSAPF
jgi:hypothetical protein